MIDTDKPDEAVAISAEPLLPTHPKSRGWRSIRLHLPIRAMINLGIAYHKHIAIYLYTVAVGAFWIIFS
jgi:hypothetical protein